MESQKPSLGTWNSSVELALTLHQAGTVSMGSSTFCPLFFWPLLPTPNSLDSFSSMRPCGRPRVLRIWRGKSRENNSELYPGFSAGEPKNQSEERQEGNSVQSTKLSVLAADGEEGTVSWKIQQGSLSHNIAHLTWEASRWLIPAPFHQVYQPHSLCLNWLYFLLSAEWLLVSPLGEFLNLL